MGAPQIIYIIAFVIDLVTTAVVHGRPKEGKYNFIATLLGWAINIAILRWGGFFS